MNLTSRDLKRLYAAHPDLVLVVLMAAKMTNIPFMVMETARTPEQQRINIKKGVSWTMNSRHLPSKDGLVRAADIVPLVDGKASWAWPIYYKLEPIMKAAAAKAGVRVEWGGDWAGRKKDGPHWQLGWKEYP